MGHPIYASARIGVAVLAAAIMAGGVASPARAQAVEAPAVWQYREDPESCRASIAFGEGADRVQLRLRSFGPGSPIEVLVASAALPNEPRSAREVRLSWDGEMRDMLQVGILGMTDTQVPTITFQFVTRPTSAFFEGRVVNNMFYTSPPDVNAQTMALRVPGVAPISMSMGSLREPLAQLEQCESALLEKWGFGADYVHRIGRPPEIERRNDVDNIIFYPAAQLLNRIGTFVQLRLKVDASGKVTDCVVQAPSGPTLFGAESCKALKRSLRMTPAEDRQGRKVESFAQIAIAFARYD